MVRVKTLILTLLLCVTSLTVNAQVRRDYQLHFYIGTAIGASTLHLPSTKQHSDLGRIYLGALSGALVGTVKEGYDVFAGNSVDGRDILWTAFGGMVGSALNVLVVEKIGRKRYNKYKKHKYTKR